MYQLDSVDLFISLVDICGLSAFGGHLAWWNSKLAKAIEVEMFH